MAKKTWEQKFDKWIEKHKNFDELTPDTGPLKKWDKWLGSGGDVPGFDDSEEPAGIVYGLTGMSGLTGLSGLGFLSSGYPWE